MATQKFPLLLTGPAYLDLGPVADKSPSEKAEVILKLPPPDHFPVKDTARPPAADDRPDFDNVDNVNKEAEEQEKDGEPSPPKPPRRRVGFRIYLVLTLVGLMLIAVIEGQTSIVQAFFLSRYASTLNYTLQPGPSSAIRYPKEGPFDIRLGYVELPRTLERLRAQGMEIEGQARFSPALTDYVSRHLFPPYDEKDQAGLDVRDSRGESLYSFRFPQRGYPDFDAVPALVVESLLFIENRGMFDADMPFANPAVDWRRFIRAGFNQIGDRVGMELPTMGGSTLATQIEKYRHSGGGLTSSIGEKLQQMASASVRAYRYGSRTLAARRKVVVSYLNTVPLSAAPGYGEVNGLGDGLRVWLGADFDQVNRLLSQPDGEEEALSAKALALRQVIALMIAQRRPSYYLVQGREELASLVDSYLRIMAGAGRIGAGLRDAALRQRTGFRDFNTAPLIASVSPEKGAGIARLRLVEMLGKSLYELDRLDLSISTTLDGEMQKSITDYLRRLNDPGFAKEAGIVGRHLLSPEPARDVLYSFILFERTPYGNLVRAQTDNNRQPFDINEDSKLELGSTAKLRVLATYLEVMFELYRRYFGKSDERLREAKARSSDTLSEWALEYFLDTAAPNLPDMLGKALERRYSANPYQAFFTGGGRHRFQNFQARDNHRRPNVRDAFRESINLVFVRLMRDLVNYSMNQRVEAGRILEDDDNPRREAYLTRFADREGRIYLRRFWRKYEGKTPEERVNILLEGRRNSPARLAAVYRYLYPEMDEAGFAAFLRRYLPDKIFSGKDLAELYRRYGPGAYNLTDQGYIARVHPLELWLLGYLRRAPEADFAEMLERSAAERQAVYAWLFRTRIKNKQDSRIRIMLEVEAFSEIHERWKRLGYPFNHLVPSLGTALGSSGDRPAALAELMGIIVNDGLRQPAVLIDRMRFGAGTPYDTSLRRQPVTGERVMAPEVAAALRDVLAGVVESGTARRLRGDSLRVNGTPVTIGGKTGTGDNRAVVAGPSGRRIETRTRNRTATFVFYLGERHFGTLTAFVPGSEAEEFSFTSSLPVQVLKGMTPLLRGYLESRGQGSEARLAEH